MAKHVNMQLANRYPFVHDCPSGDGEQHCKWLNRTKVRTIYGPNLPLPYSRLSASESLASFDVDRT